MKLTKYIPLVGLLLLGACASEAQNGTSENGSAQLMTNAIYEDISVAQFKEMMQTMPDAQILDVRTPGEWASGIIAGAKTMDIQGPDFGKSLESLNKDLHVLVYCKSGGRSGRAMDMMEKMGFAKVYNLDGGITAWREVGESVSEME